MATDTVTQRLQEAKHVVVFTGAGASAESGIPTFRDALSGLWERFAPAQLATPEAYRADPSLCWGWYEWRRQKVGQAQPNGAHLAIAELANFVPRLTGVTQNVDDLHERAGSKDVIHLHGSLHSPRCIDCGLAYSLPLTSEALLEDGSRIDPPRCSVCNGYARPGIVWFGEMLPEDAWSAGLAAAEDCDVFFLDWYVRDCLPGC
jgi:NAD-dependent deacetylase